MSAMLYLDHLKELDRLRLSFKSRQKIFVILNRVPLKPLQATRCPNSALKCHYLDLCANLFVKPGEWNDSMVDCLKVSSLILRTLSKWLMKNLLCR